MYDHEKIVNSLVDEMNHFSDLPFSDKVEYKLLKYSWVYKFVLLEKFFDNGFDYQIYQICGTDIYPCLFYNEKKWGFRLVRSFASKEKAENAYNALVTV